jgi:hypothetical protein
MQEWLLVTLLLVAALFLEAIIIPWLRRTAVLLLVALVAVDDQELE